MAAVVANVYDIPLSGFVIDPCNGETVTFDGVAHVVESVTLDGSGGFHVDLRDNIHVTGTDSPGNSYEGNEEDQVFHLNGRATLGQTISTSTTFKEIRKGSAPNFEVHFLVHILVNPHGTVKLFVDHFTANCRG